jgi:hypothetical protein
VRMKSVPLVTVAVALAFAGCKGSSSSSADGGTTASGSPSAAASADNSAAASALSLSGFEGEIDITAKGKSSPTPVSVAMLVKNDTLRIDVPQDLLADPKAAQVTGGGKVYAIIKVAQKKVFGVLDGKKQAVEIDLDQVGEQFKSMRGSHGAPGAPTPPPADPPKVVKTGKTETVAGFPCEDWEIQNKDKSKMTMCVSDKTGASFFHLPNLAGVPSEHTWALELVDGKHIPLKGVFYEKDGTEGGRFEITKLDKRPLDAAQFEVPAGYQTLSIQEMLANVMGGAGGVPPGTPLDIPQQPGQKHGGHHKGHKPPQ